MSIPAPRSVALGELPIFGRGTSTAPGILALHGWQRTGRDFDWLLADPELAEVGVMAVDLPGFGQTTLPQKPVWGTPEYAAELAASLKAKSIGPVVILAHSFGGRVAVRLAARHPELVKGLVLTGVPLIRTQRTTSSKPALGFRVAKRLNRLGVLPDSVMNKARQKHGSADYRAAGPILRPTFVKTVNENYDADLAIVGALGIPIALVWGANDSDAPTEQVAALTERLTPIVVTVGEGRGHDTVKEMRAELRAAIDAVLAVTS